MPRFSSKSSGRAETSSRLIISLCNVQERELIAVAASSRFLELRMIAIISSILERATAKPSKICVRSRALRSSKIERRVTTSRRCKTKDSMISLRLNKRG